MTRTISIKTIQSNITDTYSIKDNSPRGCHTELKENIKIGDKVVIDNYFTLVTE